MPAASAQKRARQRANKLSQLKSTISPAQTPEITPPAVEPPNSTPVPQSPTPPSSAAIDFETFIESCDLEDIHRFFDAVASKPEGRNLKLIWDRAFETGLDQGRNEERVKQDSRDREMYLQGKEMGIKQAEKTAKRADFDHYSHGVQKGRAIEQLEWTSKNHGLRCFSPVAILSDQGSQTDPEPSTTSISTQTSTIFHLETSVQTSEPPPSPNQPQKVISKPLDWAEDAYSLPVVPLPPPLRQPRDLSVLRSSSSSSPFSSLQYRSKRSNHYPRHFRHRHSHFNNSFYSSHHNLPKPSQPHFYTKTYSHLNWESDPRLSDLSWSLRALGWIHVH
jgi:hypothetical protein